MGLQKYKYKFFTISKKMVVGVLLLASLKALISFTDYLNAQSIKSLNDDNFPTFATSFKVNRASRGELEAYAAKALTLSSPDLDGAQEANDLLLRAKRPCLNCQNRLVFFDLNQNGKLSETGLKALRESFLLSPYGDEEIMKWRLSLAAKFWTSLDDDLKKSALRQITALSIKRKNRIWLKGLSSNVDEINKRTDVIKIDS